MTISDTTPRVQYTVGGGGQTAFTVNFQFFAVTDLAVYNGTSKLTYAASPSGATQYSVEGAGSSSGGTVTLGAAVASTTVTILRDVPVARSTDFPPSGPFQINSLNDALDKFTAMVGEREDQIKRAVVAPDTDPTTIDLTLPVKATRATKVLAFDSAGDPTVSTQTLATMEAGSTAAASSATAAASSATAAASSATAAANEASAAMPKYTFSTTTTIADPGVGQLRLNHATPSSASVIIIDDQTADTGNPDVEDWLKGFDDSTSTIKGYVRLVEPGTPANYAVYNITGLTDSSGYIQLAVSHVDSQGTFGDGDSIRLSFARTGDKGDTGSTGSTGSTGPRADEPGLRMIFSTATADSDQGAGKIHLNNGTASSATIVYVDDVEAGGASINGFVDSWDDSTNTALRGTITIKKNTAPENFHIFNVTGVVTSASTYSKVAATHVLSSGTISNSDSVSVQFVRTGNAGSLADPMTTRGDVIVRDSSNATARLAVGSANTVLTSDGTDPAYGQVATAMIADDAITLAKMAPGTDGNLISYDASGNPAAVATGSSGQVLTSQGAGAAPVFAAAGGGKILQVIEATTTTEVSTTSTSYVDTGLTGSITPSATGSKILVLISLSVNAAGGAAVAECKIVRTIGASATDKYVYSQIVGPENDKGNYFLSVLDSPSSTSACVYKVQGFLTDQSGTLQFQRNDGADIARSTITLMEVGA